MKPKISVIIVNYNTKDLLESCLHHILSTKENFEIIVIDNNSSDGSAQMVKDMFSEKVKLIANDKNNGLAYANNQGFKASSGEYLLYLGSDAYPTYGVLKEMTAFMDENTVVGLATSRLVTMDGTIDTDAHRGFPTPWAAITHFSKLNKLFPKSKLFNQYFLGWKDLHGRHEIDVCIAHFMLIRRSVLQELGGWDEDYFLYGEDVDICYRSKQAGYKNYYFGDLETVHLKGASVGTRKTTKNITKASESTKKRSKKNSIDAMKLFYKKHYSKKYPKVVTGFVFFGISILEFIRTKL